MTNVISKSLETLGLAKKPKKKPDGVPTIDDAREAQIESDRIRRRRGTLANIFGGATASKPTVATKQLLGE